MSTLRSESQSAPFEPKNGTSSHGSPSTTANGLAGVVAAETRLSMVDGEAGKLLIAGYPLEVLAESASFEETIYLLWQGRLPNEDELAHLRTRLAETRDMPAATLDLLRAAAVKDRAPMDALRMAAGTLDLDLSVPAPDADVGETDALAAALAARLPTVVAAYWRLLHGQEVVPPRADLGHAANFLYMLHGKEPATHHVQGLETYLNTVVDHGLNASTFAARVIIATQSDLTSALVGAIGALKGPLHGGAPGPALDTVFEIGESSRAEPVLRAKLERGERLMGFGHRVYKVRDPRADVLSRAAATMLEGAPGGGPQEDLYRLAKDVEETALRLLEEYKPGRRLQTNVEYFTALLLHGLGLSPALFTPTFAMGRSVGWLAHCREQLATGRLIRPQSTYVGPEYSEWTPISAR